MIVEEIRVNFGNADKNEIIFRYLVTGRASLRFPCSQLVRSFKETQENDSGV